MLFNLFSKDKQKAKEDKAAQNVLCYVMSGFLKLLHPFMPFITEEIFQALPVEDESIMIASFPEYQEEFDMLKEFWKESVEVIKEKPTIENPEFPIYDIPNEE